MDADVRSAPLIPPAPKVHPRQLGGSFVGELRIALEMSRNLMGAWCEEDFDNLFTPYVFMGQPGMVVSDPAAARRILSSPNYVRPVKAARSVRPIAGDGLLLSEGETWRRQRKSLAPVFTPMAVEGLLPHFVAAGASLAEALSGHARADLSEAFHHATLDAVLSALFSRRADAQGDQLAYMVRRYMEGPAHFNLMDFVSRGADDLTFLDVERRRQGAAWFQAVEHLIAQRQAHPHAEARDLLDRLLAARDEDGAPLSNQEIRDQCGTMLVAGFETTSRLLFWATYLLALDPATQDRLRAEVLAAPAAAVRTLDDLQAWPLMRSVLFETLRLYPTAPLLAREAIGPDTVMGHAVVPGQIITISPWLIHRHRKLWDAPTAFVPDRFIDQPHPWGIEAFLPFGAGPRVCIGASFALAEAQIVLASLLERFEIGLVSDRPVIPIASITLGPDHAPAFTLTPVS
ncbi:cytochrome P450 [Caulobacter vibrioides]|uniref:Cytochrome P450 family protein n=2 Tax=Caulobacter vibrioides TaxID=155892 RepID=Q9A446_CAUVC|nr:cytochrome P450 [Caulobacter vibrioides]YP_002518465.1 cytochrome P450 family protein [Caulobacter vibrioides NA1000]AAK24959.1 cytochrome P450 family protein [Caulobacter vibrioides CB15]ACL96557.1 cytochrome P450 family protein [Caulobacter vibrioides NA1000]ATC29831.1 cytochrome P450 [Caulobacter vibrioides]QXZ51347.1 cytochrome P450 [Caulobacter vibrioides]